MPNLKSERPLTRRSLMKLAAGATVALAAACSAPAPSAPTPDAPAPATTPAATAPTSGASAQPTAAAAKPAAPTSAPVAQTLTPYKHAIVLPGFGNSYAFMAKKHKFFEEFGVQAEIVQFDSDAIALKAVLANEVDSIEAVPSGSFASIEQGAELKALGAWWPKLHMILFSKREIEGIPDLVGKSVAISQPNALPHVSVLAALKELGIDPSTVTFTSTGATGLIPSLITGKVDAAPAPADNAPVVLREEHLKILSILKDVLPKFFRGAMITTDQNLRDKMPAVVGFATGAVKGLRYVLEHKEETADLVADYAKKERADILWAWDWYKENKIEAPDFYVAPESMTYMQEINVLVGTQQTVLPVEKVATWDVQQAVVKTLGPYQSKS